MELVSGATVNCKLLCLSSEIRESKTGSNYITSTFSDSEGNYDTKTWNCDTPYESGIVYSITGVVKDFQGDLSIHITRAAETEDDPSLYLKHSIYKLDDMKETLKSLIGSVKSEDLNQLLNETFCDDLLDLFSKHPAAKFYHHSFVGGLLQHTITVAKVVSVMCKIYSNADYDVAVTAALLHDIGKLTEFTNLPDVQYTLEGNAIGHLAKGIMIVNDLCRECDIDEVRRVKLLNCIASHHSKPEFGAIVEPKCLEAIILAAADGLDATVEEYLEDLNDGANLFVKGKRLKKTILEV